MRLAVGRGIINDEDLDFWSESSTAVPLSHETV
jgi:hypothetical protein